MDDEDDFFTSASAVVLKPGVKKFYFQKSSSVSSTCSDAPVSVVSPFFVKENEEKVAAKPPILNCKSEVQTSDYQVLKPGNLIQSKLCFDEPDSPTFNLKQEENEFQRATTPVKAFNGANTVLETIDLTESPEKISPKKFVFKKNILSTSSGSSQSQEKLSSPKENTILSPFYDSIQETIESVLSPDFRNFESPERVSAKKRLVLSTSKSPEVPLPSGSQSRLELNDEVTVVSQSLETCQDDFMDDDEFERIFGNSQNSENDDLLMQSTAEFDVAKDVDWGESLEEPTASFPSRNDDSQEFRKFYPHSEVMMEVLHQRFGLREFRPHQREIINASLTQHDCFVLMPTGGGKSLCYQLPALLMPGVTIVISPLRALISDQVDKLNGLDIAAAHMCSDVSRAETDSILAKLHIKEPTIKLLYLTPEKIVASRAVLDLIKSLYMRDKLARFVIDEVHCLSQWGHDFRPDYKELKLLRKQFPKVPIICLTATATKQVEGDVISILGLKNVKTFIRSFNRPNIRYQVLPKAGKSVVKEIVDLIRSKFVKKSGIIYCLGRADCDNLAQDLWQQGIKAKPYHAGMNDKLREQQQREWMQDQFHVIVATIAFGMGIDKPDVRFVIHNSIPKSVEAFYQESGRAGRDGDISYSYLFYSYGDVGRLQRLMRMDRKVNKKALDGHFENLRQMVSFAENLVDCRRYLQLMHLGEKFDRQLCINNKETTCDNCENINKYKLLDVIKEAQHLAQIVKDLSEKENVTLLHVADVYKGSKLKKILDKQHDSHRYYGSGAHLDRTDIHRILKHLIIKNILTDFCTYTGEFPIVYIKPGPSFSSLGTTKSLTIPVDTQRTSKPLPSTSTTSTSSTPSTSSKVDIEPPIATTSSKPQQVTKLQMAQIQVACHEELLEECRRLAIERQVTLSSIMNLSAIKSMSDVLPKTKEEFLKIQHVTTANYNKCGEHFLLITRKFRQKLESLQAEAPKATPPKRKTSQEDDWSAANFTQDSPAVGGKRKSTGNYRGKAKRYKKGGYKRKKGSPKKAKAVTKKKGSCGSKLSLMPIHFK